LFRKLPNLKVISQTGRNSGHIDALAAQECGVAILEGTGDPTAAAELTWALIMAATRKIVEYCVNLRNGNWQTASSDPRFNGLGTRLKDRTLGIWGYGKIGRLVAGYGRAFGMRVVVWGSENSRALAVKDGFEIAAGKADFFSQADVLSLHLRLNDITRACVTEQDFAQMKPGSLFVNTSRFELVDSAAFFNAVRSGQQAALDVFDMEPLPADSPLLKMPNVLLTPHLGYVEQRSYELIFDSAFRNLLEFLKQHDQ
jgi:D-3-phosphoglycerate dehydrogenase